MIRHDPWADFLRESYYAGPENSDKKNVMINMIVMIILRGRADNKGPFSCNLKNRRARKEGIVHIEFLEQGTTINSQRYVSTLRALKGRLRRVRQDKVKDVVIQHENARPHTSRQTQCALQQLDLPTIPHPPYSPDLAPSDLFYFLC